MEPIFDMPQVPEPEPPGGLDALRQSLRMLKELHNATVAAFREELQRAVRLRLEVEMRADMDREQHARAWTRSEGEHQADVRRWHGRFVAMFNSASSLFECLHSIPPGAIPADQQHPVSELLRVQGEALSTASEYLD